VEGAVGAEKVGVGLVLDGWVTGGGSLKGAGYSGGAGRLEVTGREYCGGEGGFLGSSLLQVS
jgi:hypothetical protein